jgi:hypothetical protein
VEETRMTGWWETRRSDGSGSSTIEVQHGGDVKGRTWWLQVALVVVHEHRGREEPRVVHHCRAVLPYAALARRGRVEYPLKDAADDGALIRAERTAIHDDDHPVQLVEWHDLPAGIHRV